MKKTKTRDLVRTMFDGKCAYTGTPLDDKWQVDHIIPVSSYLWYQPKEHRLKHGINYERNDAENLMPCVGIINHYKRSLDLEEFRKYMSDFHLRIKRLPKNPYTPKSIKTKEYMLTVASLFGITPDKPFCGQFYFEKISVLNQPSPL